MKRMARPVAWVLVGVAATLLLGMAAVIFVQSLVVYRVDGLGLSDKAAALQAFAAAGALAGTAALIGVTAYYAWVTAEMLRRANPIVRISLQQAWVHPYGGAAIMLPLEVGILRSPPDPGHTKFMFAIEVRNSGGAGTTIDKAAVEVPGGAQFWQPTPSVGPGFPYRLEAHASVTFLIEPDAVAAVIKVLETREVVVGSATLATGETWKTEPIALRMHTGREDG